MSKIHVDFIRGKEVESSHQVKVLVTNANGKILLSTNNDNEFFFPRSSIKIFQAIPFAMSNAIKNYKLNNKHIALACASHKGEKIHIRELKKWISKINKSTAFAIDTETDSVHIVSANLIGISLSVAESEGCYIPIGHSYDDCPKQLSMDYVIKTLGPAIEENQEKAIGQNLKFDIPILARHGIVITKFLADTMLMSYVLNSTATRHGMDRLADFYLNYTTTKYTDVTGTASKQIPFSEVKLDIATDYAAEDADITLRLFNVLQPLLKEKPTQEKLLHDLELSLIHI